MASDTESRAFSLRPVDTLSGPIRTLLLLLPDQLSSAYLRAAKLDRQSDIVLQIEAIEDFNHVPCHKQRSALILSAMRHFSAETEAQGWRCAYEPLDRVSGGSLTSVLEHACSRLEPEKLMVFRPGDFRTLERLQRISESIAARFEVLEDPCFLITPSEFADWASQRRSMVMEHFYRWMRRRFNILTTGEGKPVGGAWNYDANNRKTLGSDSPPPPDRITFPPDVITRDVLHLVKSRLRDAPGRLASFAWPTTRTHALEALRHFIRYALPSFGDYQDAMKAGEPWLFHSLLSPALNLKLLDPLECVDAALEAYRAEEAPLNSVEGFVRQIIGWREFIRGIYWHEGRDYGRRNFLDANGDLPHFYWDAKTDLHCVAESVGQVLKHGYGHHIQRLMVTGNLALLAGVDPRQCHAWYLGMFVDAMDWVTLPNVIGMVMYADGGVVGSKPYAASGRYVHRMSDYCGTCRYRPELRSGDEACPITTLYWDFLDRNRKALSSVPRMGFAMANLKKMPPGEIEEIRGRATELRRMWEVD